MLRRNFCCYDYKGGPCTMGEIVTILCASPNNVLYTIFLNNIDLRTMPTNLRLHTQTFEPANKHFTFLTVFPFVILAVMANLWV